MTRTKLHSVPLADLQDDEGRAVLSCRRPACRRVVTREVKAGRPRLFCSKDCADQFVRDKRKAASDLAYAVEVASQHGIAVASTPDGEALAAVRAVLLAARVAVDAALEGQSTDRLDGTPDLRAALAHSAAALRLASAHLQTAP